MIIFTPEQREQLANFLTESRQDHDCYFVGEDGSFYMRLPSPQEPVLVPDETMLDTTLARAGLVFEQGKVEQDLVNDWGLNGDISSQYIFLETRMRVYLSSPLLLMKEVEFNEAWHRIFGNPIGDAQQSPQGDSEADDQKVPDSQLERLASGVENLQL